MSFKIQLHNAISKNSYTNSKEFLYHGTGQGAGNVGTEWIFISVPMVNVAEELTEGCTTNLPQGNTTWTIHILGFVDDKRHYIDNLKNRVLQRLLEALKKLIHTWNELLLFVGGQLEMDKNAWYLIKSEFDSLDTP